MAVVAVPFILYLVRFCSSKSCNMDDAWMMRAVSFVLLILYRTSTTLI